MLLNAVTFASAKHLAREVTHGGGHEKSMRNGVLVTGGAGYVGSHACLRLAEAGFKPIVFDDLSNGHERFVQWGPLVRGDIRDRAAVAAA